MSEFEDETARVLKEMMLLIRQQTEESLAYRSLAVSLMMTHIDLATTRKFFLNLMDDHYNRSLISLTQKEKDTYLQFWNAILFLLDEEINRRESLEQNE